MKLRGMRRKKMAEKINGAKLIEKARRWKISDESFRHEKVAFSHFPVQQQERALMSYKRRMLDPVQLEELRQLHLNRTWL
jgi:hypothetical protein